MHDVRLLMSDIRFTSESVNPRFMDRGLDNAFQLFASDVLKRNYPNAHFFPCAGKDGAIDGSQPCNAALTVIECKQISKDGIKDATDRWDEVADRLSRNIVAPGGPPSGQSQYAPWYERTRPIQEYVFTLSSLLPNQACIDNLTQTIEAHFRDLASTHAHLNHLASIRVKVLDWGQLYGVLKTQPHLVFRWFPGQRPLGLVPFDDPMNLGALSSFLSDTTLPYYSRAQHLKIDTAPPNIDIPDENRLLSAIGQHPITGLVITGVGGVGKTRLALQIGSLAVTEKWCVFRAGKTLNPSAIDSLAERLGPEDRVLIVMDYVEMRPDFATLIDRINDINDTYQFKVGYVATCRGAYYQRKLTGMGRHVRLDLSFPAESDALRLWLTRYRRAAVNFILDHSGIPQSADTLRVCHDIPMLAVFMSYLRQQGREADLHDLLESADFGSWVSKRLVMTHQEDHSKRSLALLMCGLPLSDSSAKAIRAAGNAQVLDDLAGDGWIEHLLEPQSGEGAQWSSVHDVVADQVVISYCRSVPATVTAFVQDALRFGREMGCLRSVLLTLQRVADVEQLNGMPWASLLSSDAKEHLAEWRTIRILLLSTSLMGVPDLIKLLEDCAPLWVEAEKEEPFRNRIGWLARQVAKDNNSGDVALEYAKAILGHWIELCLPHITRSNYIVTSGLLLVPELIYSFALDWIRKHANEHQAHYLLVVWLDKKLNPSDVRSFVISWIASYPMAVQCSFLFESWFKASRETACMALPVRRWLHAHATIPPAAYVISSWLRAGGALPVIEESVPLWLAIYDTTLRAGWLYAAWLDSNGNPNSIKPHISRWFEVNGLHQKAGKVLASWIGSTNDAVSSWPLLKKWLDVHGNDALAWLPLSKWLDTGGKPKVVRKYIKSWMDVNPCQEHAEYLYRAWLQAGGDFPFVECGVSHWLANYVDKPWSQYLIKFVVKQRRLSPELIKHCLIWCQLFPDNCDAIHRLNRLQEKIYGPETAELLCTTIEAVIPCVDENNDIHKNTTTHFLKDLFAGSASWPMHLRCSLMCTLDHWMSRINGRFICSLLKINGAPIRGSGSS